MNYLRIIILALLLVLLFRGGVYAEDAFRFSHVTTSDGLSNSWVRSIFQDEVGYLWFGTSDGLNRFDGQTVKVFKNGSKQGASFGDLKINALLAKNASEIWLGTDVGLYVFNLEEEEFFLDTIIPPHPVLSMVRDSNLNVWFGTNNGLFRKNSNTSEINAFFSAENSKAGLANNYVNALFVDSENRLWAGTKNGLSLFDNEIGLFVNFLTIKPSKELAGNDITSICEDNQKRIWIGSSIFGVYCIDTKQKQFVPVKRMDGYVGALLVDSKDKLWVCQNTGKGIRLVDLNKLETTITKGTTILSDPLDLQSISDNSVHTVFQDKNRNIWIGTEGGGVNFYSYRFKPFFVVKERFAHNTSIRNNLVNAIYEEENYLWIGTQAGIDRLDKRQKVYEHFEFNPNNPHSLGANVITSLYKDSRGNFWVGTWGGGVNRFDYHSNRFTRYLPGKEEGTIGSANAIWFCEDKYHNLWIGTNGGGLNRYDYRTNRFKKYIKDPKNKGSISGRSMSHVFCTRSGDLYVSMYTTLEKYNYQTDQFEHFIHPTNTNPNAFMANITSMFEDSKGNLWLTTNAGLEYFNPAKNEYRSYSMQDGLPDNTIQSIEEDNHGNLWLGTNFGLSKFIQAIDVPANPQFQNFSTKDGLPANDFKRLSSFKNSSGILYFGTSAGYVYFHPDSIKLNETIPNIVFTDFLLLETKPNQHSKFKELNQNIDRFNELHLFYPNTDFTIGFAALNYLNSDKNSYRYKLEGYDTQWIEAGSKTNATYTNLSEGVYTFHVLGSNNDGVWNETPRKISIIVHPPWWRTTIFKFLVIIAVIFIISVFLITRFQIIQKEKNIMAAVIDKRTNELSKLNRLLEAKQEIILKQNDELLQHRQNLENLVEERTTELATARKKAEDSDRLKSAFLANMSHEIRTPMNAIVGFSGLLANSELSPEKKARYAEMIQNNSKSLFVLINDIIDISIIEANQLVLSKAVFNVNTILTELFTYFSMENKDKFDFKYNNLRDTDLFLYNDAVRFRQIMNNLLSNAFKYSDHGAIQFGYEIGEDAVTFYVSDTGIGIDKEEIEKIFELFFKSLRDKSKLYRGTGIGLAICKKLVVQMGGDLWVDSEVGKGSSFYFTLPLKDVEV
jgi:signal transduction histidine kinase/ligand-binding sensor domain-containing protein